MSSIFGIEASRAVQYVVAFAIILVLVALFGLVLRKLTGGRLMIPGHDRGRSRQPRLGVVDIYDLDRQRQLVLLRRDNVEHLLLIGGLNDVVIETNIVRVAGARIPATPADAIQERVEPAFDQPLRPQVEPSARPSVEAQLAAQLGSVARKPSDESDIDEELASIGSLAAPVPARPEPILRPDRVTATVAPPVQPPRPEPQPQPQFQQPRQPQPASFLRAPATPAPARPEPVRSEPIRPEPVRPEPVRPEAVRSEPVRPEPVRPEPIRPEPVRPEPVRPEPRPAFAPTPFQSRPTPTPPPAPAPAPEIVRAPQPAAAAAPNPDAAILSDMAKQLEEALKRPAQGSQPASGPVGLRTVEPDLDEDDLLVPTDEDEEEVQDRPLNRPAVYDEEAEPEAEPAQPPAAIEPPRPGVEPARPAGVPHPVPSPVAAAPAPSGQPQPAAKVPDPFSVEDIEAEFARLLGRPRDSGNKG